MELRVLSVNVALPRIIGYVHSQPISSGIAKIPVDTPSVFVGRTNIAGDEQADLSVHGGPDKAVYSYPSDHWPWWVAQRLPCVPATFGENLTLAGATEGDVHIGDRFLWGDAVLEISQPRAPCYKFAIHTARPDAPQLMTVSARCGWYLRVIEEGQAPVGASMTRLTAEAANPTVNEAFRAMFDPRMARDARLKVYDTPVLAEAWREG
ncbi:MAG TPA: MOSC domain-containing protein, partial [Rhizomicrobium sp.]